MGVCLGLYGKSVPVMAFQDLNSHYRDTFAIQPLGFGMDLADFYLENFPCLPSPRMKRYFDTTKFKCDASPKALEMWTSDEVRIVVIFFI